MLFAAVALTGVLASVGMQTLTGPVTTITRVTQKNIADTQLLMDSKIIISAAVTGTLGGDSDTDGIIEPAPYVPASGGETPPAGGGYLPTTLGLSLTDPWGTKYGYCVWDHGSTNTSANRLTGDNTSGANTQAVIAVIAAGPDKTFQTTCSAYTSGPISVAKASGSDDLIFKYTYAEASANSNGLWTLNVGDQAKAELKDSGGTANVTIDRSTGVGDFIGVTTGMITAKTDIISVGGGLKLDDQTNVTVCASGDEGVLRYNVSTFKLEVCNGTVWKAAASDLWLENGNDIYSGNSGNVGIGTSTPSEKLDVTGNTNVSGNSAIGGTLGVTGAATLSSTLGVTGAATLSNTLTVTGNTAIDTDTLFVDAAANAVGIGTVSPDSLLHVVGASDLGTLGAFVVGNAPFHLFDGTSNLYMDGRGVISDKDMILGTTGAFGLLLVTDETSRLSIAADGTTAIYGNTSVGGTLGVMGAATLSSTLGVTGATTLSDTLEVAGNTAIDTNTLYVDAAGNSVGIGTTSPAAALEVVGAIKIGSQATCGAGGTNNGTVRYDTATQKFQLCVDGVWGSISSIDALNDIGDVNAPSPADNDILAWDNATGRWVSKNIALVGPASITPAGSDGSVQYKDGSDLGADAANFHWDKTNHRLGLGTNTPTQTLDVAGKVAISDDTTMGAKLDVAGGVTFGDTLDVTGDFTVDIDGLYVDATNNVIGIGTLTPLAKLDVAGAIKLGSQVTCAAGGANDGTLRYNGADLQMCKAGTWLSFSQDASNGIAGSVPDAIDCGVSGYRRLLYLTTTTATAYQYQLISGAASIGMQVDYAVADGSHVATKNTALWTNATGCDGKDIATLESEGRAYYLMDGTGVVGAGGAPGDATYITQTPNAGLTNEQALSTLASGIVKVTTGTGVLTSGAVDLSGAEATGTLAAGRFPALTGDVTTTAGSLATTLASDAVTFAKMQNINSGKLLGRASAGAGDTEEIGLGTGFSFSAGSLVFSELDPQIGTLSAGLFCQTNGAGTAVDCDNSASAMRTALGLGALATLSTVTSTEISDGTIAAVDIAADAVTEAKLKAIDTAVDEECLTYESTGGDFEWQPCDSAIANVSDGDKGDITVASGVWSLDAGVVDSAELAASSVIASKVAADVLDFTEFKDAMTLDASTDIAVTGTNVLSVTNTGTGNSLLVNDEAADATPFVVDASGNVGIGMTVPSTLLDVAGTARTKSFFVILATSAAEGGQLILADGGNTTATGQSNSTWSIDNYYNSVTTTNDLRFFHQDSSGTTLLPMSIKDNGNVGIATTSPQSLLQVASTGYAQFSKTFAGAPTGADCDDVAEAGRVTYDTSGNVWYVCEGAGGWANASSAGGPPTGTAGGDLSGSYPNPTVAKINGVALGSATATAGNLLIGSGTQWVSTAVSGAGTLSSAGVLSIAADNLDFTEFKDAMTLDASTDIAVTGSNVLSVTNTGTGNSFVVNDVASDTTPFVVDASGNVGIGTAAPVHRLQLDLDTNNGGIVVNQKTASKQASLIFQSAGTTKWALGKQIDDSLFFWDNANGKDFMEVKTDGTVLLQPVSGNVGIGVTAPAYRLDVADTSTATSGNVFGMQVAESVTPAANSSATFRAVSNYLTLNGSVNYTGSTIAARSVAQNFSTGSVAALYGAQNVASQDAVSAITNAYGGFNYSINNSTGAGTIGTSYGAVNKAWESSASGSTASAYGAYNYVELDEGGSITNAYGSSNSINITATGTGNITNAYSVRANVNDTGSGTVTNGYGLYIDDIAATNDWGVYQSAATDDNYFAGNVGIGTSAPGAKLDVVSTVNTVLALRSYSGSSNYTPHFIGFKARGTEGSPTYPLSGDGLASFQGRSGVGAAAWPGMSVVSTENQTATAQGADIRFFTVATGTVVTSERMRIDQNGNVGIGTTTPGQKLEVNGNVKATAYLNTSDRRLKDDIASVNGLEIIRKLRGVSFVWKDSGKHALGLIAQEVEEVLPFAVATDDKGFKSVDYIMMIAPMIESIKTLDAEVTRLRAENDALKARVDSLEKRLKAIEEKLASPTVH